jgi:hypothetical protein
VDKIVRKADKEDQAIDFKRYFIDAQKSSRPGRETANRCAKFCTQSVDKIVCKRKSVRQVP